MGALILLLIVTTRRIRNEVVERTIAAQAIQEESAPTPSVAKAIEGLILPDPADSFTTQAMETSVAKSTPPAQSKDEQPILPTFEPEPKTVAPKVAVEPPPLVEDKTDWAAVVAELIAKRDAQKRATAGRMQQIGFLKSEIEEIEQRLRRAQAQLQRVDQEMVRKKNLERAAMLRQSELKNEVVNAKREVQQFADKASAPSEFAFVAYDGRSGTTRKPILIELKNNSVRFVPEGVRLTSEQLETFSATYNPILAGAKALVDYTIEQQDKGASSLDPYVLLIVRPSAGQLFYVTRHYLSRLGTPTGYELVDEDFRLSSPEIDYEAKRRCEEAVARVVAKQDQIFRAMSRNAVLGNRDVIGNSTGRGVKKDYSDPLNRRRRRASDTFFGSDSFRSRSIEEEAGAQGPTQNGSNGIASGSGRPNAIGSKAGTAKSGLGQGPNGQRLPQASVNGNSPNGAVRPNTSATGAAKKGDIWDPLGEFAAGANGRGKTGDVKDSTSIGTKQNAGDSTKTSLGQVQRPQDQKPQGKAPQPGTSPGNSGLVNRDAKGSSESSGTGDDGPAGRQASAKAAGKTSTNQGNSNGVRDRNPLLDLDQKDATATGSGASLPFNIGSSSNQSTSGNIGLPSASRTTPRRNSRAPKVAPKRRWGEYSPGATIGFERKMSIKVYSDRVIFGDRYQLTIPPNADDAAVQRQVVRGVEAKAKSWGAPPDNFYWIPMIEYKVSPTGRDNFKNVFKPLKEAGLYSTMEFVDEPKQKETKNGSTSATR